MRWPWLKADPEVIAEIEAENKKLDEYIDSTDPSTPYPDLSGVDRPRGCGTVIFDAPEPGGLPAAVVQVAPTNFNVVMQPLRAPDPPKKRELFKPPILDDNYFARKRREHAEREEQRYMSASQIGRYYGGASYYGIGSMSGGYPTWQ